MQLVIINICHHVRLANLTSRVAFFFDREEKVSGKAKVIFDDLRARNKSLEPYIGALTYDDRCKLVPLQIADELAFEIMKNADGLLHGRPERKPILRLKESHNLIEHDFLKQSDLEKVVQNENLQLIDVTE